MDVLRSFYTTEIRLGPNEGDPVATIRWYPTLYDSAFPEDGSAFFSNVWETEVGSMYPQPGLGEISLEKEWAKGVQPAGINGKTTYTPLDWFVTGPPPEAFENLPIGSCGKLQAPKLLPAQLGYTFKSDEQLEEQCFQLGLGFCFELYIPGYYYWCAQLGLGFQFQARIDGGYPIVAPIGLGLEFGFADSYSVQFALETGASIETIPSYASPMSMDLEQGFDFDGQTPGAGSTMELGLGFVFDAIVPGYAFFVFALETGFDFNGEWEQIEFDFALETGFDFYEPEELGFDFGEGLGFEFEAETP